MIIKNATMEIRPRTVTEIVDLAGLFYRRHLGLIFKVTLILGLPLLGLSMGIHYLSGQAWLALLFFWTTFPLSTGAVIVAASRVVFGIPMTASSTLSAYKKQFAGLFFQRIGQNLLVLLLSPLVVGYIMRLSWMFTPMIVLLERLTGAPMATRRRGLNRRGGAGAFGLDMVLMLICLFSILGIMVIFELFASDILSLWNEDGLFSGEVFSSPMMLGAWMLAALLVSPICTLSWFFLYLDARIRGEGWDLELAFKGAAARIDGGGGRE